MHLVSGGESEAEPDQKLDCREGLKITTEEAMASILMRMDEAVRSPWMPTHGL